MGKESSLNRKYSNHVPHVHLYTTLKCSPNLELHPPPPTPPTCHSFQSKRKLRNLHVNNDSHAHVNCKHAATSRVLYRQAVELRQVHHQHIEGRMTGSLLGHFPGKIAPAARWNKTPGWNSSRCTCLLAGRKNSYVPKEPVISIAAMHRFTARIAKIYHCLRPRFMMHEVNPLGCEVTSSMRNSVRIRSLGLLLWLCDYSFPLPSKKKWVHSKNNKKTVGISNTKQSMTQAFQSSNYSFSHKHLQTIQSFRFISYSLMFCHVILQKFQASKARPLIFCLLHLKPLLR